MNFNSLPSDHRSVVLSRLQSKFSKLTTGDLDRLDQFAAALVERKAAKRNTRAKRREKPVVTFAVLEGDCQHD